MKYTIILLFFFNLAAAQQTKFVDFKSVHANISIDPDKRSVTGTATYEFEVLSKIDTIRIDAIGMQFANVEINGKQVPYKSASKALLLFKGFRKGHNTVSFKYTAFPKQTMYFVRAGDAIQIWTQGQGKYTSHWFPSFDDTNEKVIFNMSVSQNGNETVLSNGILDSVKVVADDKQWNFKMQHPMSSYLLMIAIGDFNSTTVQTNSGIPLELYIEREDQAKWEPTYRHSRQIFDYLVTEIAVLYPWEIYKQVPVRDFLYAGMENTSATVFSRDFVVDSVGYNDRNYVNVNAHELAHQWFGDMVTAKSGEHHWLQEGFATYYALLAERDVFGDDYFYMKMYDMAENLQRAAKTDTIPILNAKASALTFYQKGAWALHVLREGVGVEKFRMAVRNYLNKYKFKNVETADFLNEINAVSDYDTKKFSTRWLERPGFEIDEALLLLKRNPQLNQYFTIAAMAETPFLEKREIFEDLMRSTAGTPIKEEMLLQTQQVPFSEKEKLVQMAMASSTIKVRQTVAKTLRDFPVAFLPVFESLLDDDSYVTQEIALNVLWSQFPKRQEAILNKTAGRVGMNDKNIRILWLTLALATKDYRLSDKAIFYDELLEYASPMFESSVRMNAIESLLYLDKMDSNVLKYLVNATIHHKWQLTQFARNKIRDQIKSDKHKLYYLELLPNLSENEKSQLHKLLNE